MATFKKLNRKTRYKTKSAAWMTLDGGFAKRNCTVLDISSTGARIDVQNAGSFDSRVSIAFSNDVHKMTRCRLVWRQGSVIGVEFLNAA